MKKPKTKLEKAKEKFLEDFEPLYWEKSLPVFRRRLNELIRLAKQEGRE